MDEKELIEAFRGFLKEPSSRCTWCLTDEPEVKLWYTHHRLGRVFTCGSCVKKMKS